MKRIFIILMISITLLSCDEKSDSTSPENSDNNNSEEQRFWTSPRLYVKVYSPSSRDVVGPITLNAILKGGGYSVGYNTVDENSGFSITGNIQLDPKTETFGRTSISYTQVFDIKVSLVCNWAEYYNAEVTKSITLKNSSDEEYGSINFEINLIKK